MNSAQYECEGHIVVFLVEDNQVIVKQIYEAQQTVSTHELKLDKDKAIKYEEELVQLGYDKVS